MLLSIVSILGGCLLLILGANYLVDGASSIARRFGVSSLVIGLTVVAFGTSAPELAVNLLSALSGSTDLALGNINGSNIANILLILGCTAVFATIPIKRQTILKEIPFALLTAAVLVVAGLDLVLGSGTADTISRTDGIFFLGFFVIFLYYLFYSAKNTASAEVEEPKYKTAPAILFTVLGLAALILGGRLAVSGATTIATALGVSEMLIGLTIVAVGTSLPELVSSIVAARKGEADLAIGNVIGSNVFNVLFVLAVTAIIKPIPVSQDTIIDSIVVFAVTALLIAVLFLRKETSPETRQIDRKEGIFFILLYIAYVTYIILRG